MSEVLEFLGTIGTLVADFVLGIVDLIESLFSFISLGFEFIIACILKFNDFINLGLLNSLPQFFAYGIYTLFCVVILVLVFKLFQIFKFW